MFKLRSILATDCGSTTTKAILIEREDDRYRLTGRGEAPTTVEAPLNDVTLGVRHAIVELQELRGRPLISPDGALITPQDGPRGVDLYVTTSSAGGGLQMLVAGVVRRMSAESAERAALCAGAVVMETIALDDGRRTDERIERIRDLRPDIVLLTGGTDGGTIRHVARLAETIAAARPRGRAGDSLRLPVVYAGNREARDIVMQRLGEKADVSVVENLRPDLDYENPGPVRDRIHELFLGHVMAHAPGYPALQRMAARPVMPTPAAVGRLIESYAATRRLNVVGVDIGGATTDVFSCVGGRFNRTVSANLGVSYSISTVLATAGADNVIRWMPFDVDPRDLRDRIRNKMVRPTTIPETIDDLKLEHAVAREALRLSFEQHRAFARDLAGAQRERGIADALRQRGRETLDPLRIDLMIGSGGVLSHAPRRAQAMMLMIDGLQPAGVTRLVVDRVFMMPHLGVLAEVDIEAAMQVFEHDCLVPLGTVIAPVGRAARGTKLCRVEPLETEYGLSPVELSAGEFIRWVPGDGRTLRVRITPRRSVDVGAGWGRAVEVTIETGVVGVVLDGRGRPLDYHADSNASGRNELRRWLAAMEAYP
ncbi:MAG: glutamate mutase L [Phycisphaerae bacterium]|nr:glutamate mutase L [Phycisphaerae bacterium]NUQ44981.1 glutamate mutase L [Phycisphaerae bacterium]